MNKTIFDALDALPDGAGAPIVALIKRDFAPFKDLYAKLRITTHELESLKANPPKGEPNTELERSLHTMQKQIDTLTKTIATEREEKEKIQKQANTEKLRNEVSSDLSIFGKAGEFLADQLISNEKLRYVAAFYLP